VSEVLAQAKSSLEGIRATVVGEVSGLADKPGYKAAYFSLCDESGVLPCLMWRREYEASGVALVEGTLVEVEGFLTLYAAKGRMQFQVRRLALAGEGVLRMQVAALVERLAAEGFLADERKRPLPTMPERVGLVTSPRGKAVHDVIRTLRRRFPLAELMIAGVKVEGRGAADAIKEGLRAVEDADVDVALLVRGGGSYEDLMPFNDETLARAIAASPIPVVTGIGHEPDTTIADMVADVRASTPTAAAETVAPDVAELEARLRHASGGLGRALSAALMRASHRLERVGARPVFCDAYALLARDSQRVDQAADALARALPGRLERDALRLRAADGSLRVAGERTLERARSRQETLGGRLGDLSPLAILERGYAICTSDSGEVVRAADQLSVGQPVGVRFAAGRAACRVEGLEMEEEA
jgi:exodeoxyribonuclease VII large subunit